MTAMIRHIPNEPHMARVREARRAAGLWLPSGFPSAPSVTSRHAVPSLVAVEGDDQLTGEVGRG